MMQVVICTKLLCTGCGYERMISGDYDPKYLDMKCPCCVDLTKYAGWATKAGAEPVRFITGDKP